MPPRFQAESFDLGQLMATESSLPSTNRDDGFVGIDFTAASGVFDQLPIAIYLTDAEGSITYFNPASVAFAGRLPVLNADKWCVTWKLYTMDGVFLPHDACPMAVAVRTRRAVRNVTAFAERPGGGRVPFRPFPTPVVDRAGAFVGAFNMLMPL